MGNATKTLAGRYILDELLAQGGMASVWLGRDEVLARRVAVKILHPNLAGNENFLARFKREAMAAARLAHPHIVSIFDTGDDTGDDGQTDHFIVMEHCGGGSLQDLLARERSLAPSTVTSFGVPVCDALHYAHSNRVIHRDVKPGNVLLGSSGNVKVADFGIAKAAGADDISTTGTLLGTVAYISPEQANGAEPDERSDIYSTGVLLYELLTGKPPFSGSSHVATALMHVNQHPRPPRSVRAGIPRALDDIVMTALAKDPDARFSSAAEMRTALESSGAGTPTSRPAVATSPSPSGGSLLAESNWLMPVVALIAGVVVVAAVLAAIFSESPILPGGGDPEMGRLRIVAATPFDPGGDGDEHSDEAHLAHDRNPSTRWPTETYSASLQAIGKSGVGLVFDLAGEQTVGRVVISSPLGGYALEIRSAAALPTSLEDTELVAELEGADTTAEIEFEPTAARYWIVWITSLPGGGGGRAEISEVTFFGS